MIGWIVNTVASFYLGFCFYPRFFRWKFKREVQKISQKSAGGK